MRNRFYGLCTDERVCVDCRYSNETQAVFTHLSLNIVGAKSLAECLRQFLSTEMLDGNNMVSIPIILSASSCELKQSRVGFKTFKRILIRLKQVSNTFSGYSLFRIFPLIKV